MRDAPYQIKRLPGSVPGTYEFRLIDQRNGRTVSANYRQKSPVPDKLILKTQAALNSAWVFLQKLPHIH